jgi:hypothetical protein
MARMGRINVRVDKELQRKIKVFAEREERTTAELCRILFETACEQYEAVLGIALMRRLGRWAAKEYERVGHIEMLRRLKASEEEKPVRRGKETK